MMKFNKFGVIAVAALSAVAFAAVDGISIARKVKEGDIARYKMSADIDFGGMDIKFSGLVEEKIAKVNPDGTYSLEQNQIEGKVNVAGQEQEMPTSGVNTTVYLPNGEVKEIVGEQGTEDAYRMANLSLIRDPGKELKVGDTWTHEFKANAKTGAVAAKAEYKVLGEEKVGTYETVKIKADVKETAGSEPASSNGTAWINKADGSLIKLEAKWVNAPFPGAPAPINAVVKLERVK